MTRTAAALSGLGFVACFAVAAALYGSGAGSRPAEITAYYARSGDRARQIAGFAVLLAGCVLLLVFVGRLARVAGVGNAALGSGIAATALLAVANALWAASALTVELEPGYRIGPGDSVRRRELRPGGPHQRIPALVPGTRRFGKCRIGGGVLVRPAQRLPPLGPLRKRPSRAICESRR